MKNQQDPIVIQGAMGVETQYIIDQMTDVREEPFGPFRCAHGLFEGHALVVCETQWGMANASALAALAKFYGSLAEEMEGDAVAQVCQSFDVPFLDVRIISNSILLNQDPWDLGTGPVCQEFVLALLREYWQDVC